ncbi:MAG: hypothetical protein ACYDD1_10850 [Caulobacteraceae bacterium]
MPDQNNSDDNAAPETATQKLAALVARKKLESSGGGPASKGAQLQAERQAAARATSKSKPALRKG